MTNTYIPDSNKTNTTQKSSFYAYVKIPVMLCWNDDYGNFDNQIRQIDIHDSIQLDSNFIDEESCESIGLECALGTNEDAGSTSIGDAMAETWREDDERFKLESETSAPANDCYTGASCKKCGRNRVYLRKDGQAICEKCGWLQEKGEYFFPER